MRKAKRAGKRAANLARTRVLSGFLNRSDQPDRATLIRTVETLRSDMEVSALEVRDITLTLPPVQLLAWSWGRMHMLIASDQRRDGNNYRPDKFELSKIQFALEYLHAIWSCHSITPPETTPFDEEVASRLMDHFDSLREITLRYCLASSLAKRDAGVEEYKAKLEYDAKFSWVCVRGHRYQVLEEEFFRYVLAPHAEPLLLAYGMEPNAIAHGLQAVSDSLRVGFSNAAEKLASAFKQAEALLADDDQSMDAAIATLTLENNKFSTGVADALQDLFQGGICNLSRHSGFSSPLLEDFSYYPGQNLEFFAGGNFAGTPMRTLPSRIRPGIKLGDSYYFTDGQFVRDSAYRAIQRGLLARLPAYRVDWTKRQTDLVETALPRICLKQFCQSKQHSAVFYRDIATGGWVECDLLVIQDDVLFVIEAKSGAMPMHSPETHFDRFEHIIGELVLKAYAQCKRFVNYLASAPTVLIYRYLDGKYIPNDRLRLSDFRSVIPIGLTIEAFTPFSAMVKARPNVEPLLQKHHFISMSVDDLFVLNRFLPTTGELLHYFEVRQRAAEFPAATIFDEVDHLGAYITRNRFDMDLKEFFKTADYLLMDNYCDVVDRYFEGENWQNSPTPKQPIPPNLGQFLEALDRLRPKGWLKFDSMIRDLSSETKLRVDAMFDNLLPSLQQYTYRRLFSDEPPMQIWICRQRQEPTEQEIHRSGQVGCLIYKKPAINAAVISYTVTGQISRVRCHLVGAPTIFQHDYPSIIAESKLRISELQPTERKTKLKFLHSRKRIK